MNGKDKLEKLCIFFTENGKIDYGEVARHLEIPNELNLIHKEACEEESKYLEIKKKINDKKLNIQKNCSHPIIKVYTGYDMSGRFCEICGVEV